MKELKQSLPSGGFYDVAGEKTHSEHLNTQTVCAQNQNQIRTCQKDQTLMLLTSSELGHESTDLGRLDHTGGGGLNSLLELTPAGQRCKILKS